MRFIIPVLCVLGLVALLSVPSGCARIVPPSGGPRDSLPPVMVKALPKDSALHQPLTGLKIIIGFDEHIQLDNVATNLLVNPSVKVQPIVELTPDNKGMTIRMKDTLEPDATYTLNFGKGVKDVNEGNVLRNFTYIFSTGGYLDSGALRGRVRLARNNKVDSTLMVVLHRHDDDSAVSKETPRYFARLDSMGRFLFLNIAVGTYSIYAFKDAGDHKYHDKSVYFAFYDHRITVTNHPEPSESLVLYAYAEEGPKPKTTNNNKKSTKKEEKKEHKLHLSVTIQGGKQDLLTPLYFQYDQPIGKMDSTVLQLTDTNYRPLP